MLPGDSEETELPSQEIRKRKEAWADFKEEWLHSKAVSEQLRLRRLRLQAQRQNVADGTSAPVAPAGTDTGSGQAQQVESSTQTERADSSKQSSAPVQDTKSEWSDLEAQLKVDADSEASSGEEALLEDPDTIQLDDASDITQLRAELDMDELFPIHALKNEDEVLLRQEAMGDITPVTQTNRASRRLWLGLKYWDGEPVLRKAKMLSRPTQRLWLTHEDLSKIIRGRRSNYVDGMTRIGECLFLSTDKGIMEARECEERRIGGLALCRVWG